MTGPTQKKLPLVSVIIPTFNNGRFIGPALESLFRQTYPGERREIIVVDDGSTDNTPEALKKYGQNIFQIHQQHRGIASARNTGISHARGEIITFLDSDDLWYEERLQKVVERFVENPRAGMVYHPVELIDSEGNTIVHNFYYAFGYKEEISGWVANEIFSGRIYCGGSSFAFRKAIIDRIYPIPEDIKRGVDYYMIAFSSCFTEAEYILDILGKYRFHGNNISMWAGRNNRKDFAAVNKDFAYMRGKLLEQIIGFQDVDAKGVDLNIIRRRQEQERIFSHILDGERVKGIKRIPSLFKGRPDHRDLLRGMAICFMALFIPAFGFSKLLKLYENLKRLQIIKF